MNEEKGGKPGISRVVKRKRRTRHKKNTEYLKKWIASHPENLYPVKEEKILLGEISGLDYTQVDNFFGNTRRRIKKIGIQEWLETHLIKSSVSQSQG